MNFNMELEGLDTLVDLLSKLSNSAFAEEALHSSLMRGARVMQGQAKINCPVDTGQLRNSIAVCYTTDGVEVYTNVEYAEYVEYGTGKQGDSSVAHTTKDRWSYRDADGKWHTTRGQPPNPFWRTAIEQTSPQIKTVVKNALMRRIREV